jgi:FkbM family methyltransferase
MSATLVQWIDRQSWFHRIIRLLRVRSLASFLLRICPLTRTYANGTRIKVADLESFFLSDEIFKRQTYREALSKAGQVRTVVDLGSNVGFFCCYLRDYFGRSDFQGFGIDANPNLLGRAQQNLDLNDLNGIELINGLVGSSAKNSSQDFFVYASHLGSSQFIQPEEGRTLKGGWSKIAVPVVTVSEMWRAKHGDTLIDLLKVDIEGSEGKLLQADSDLFRQTKSIVLEWHKWLVKREELFPVLAEMGFLKQELIEAGDSTELWGFFRE